MSKYLIHACNQRMWYVNDYLIPSMLEQGIDRSNIRVYLDKDNEGCLESCMKAFLSVPIDEGGVWHMQDDVIICSDFKRRTEDLDSERRIVCGFCYGQDNKKSFVGNCTPKEMWYSFPCIRIPNRIARGCADWYYRFAKFDNNFRMWVRVKKYDDAMFNIYVQDYHSEERVLNLIPNLVEHVDDLIGGSIVNCARVENTHSICFEEIDLVKNLEQKLKKQLTNY